MLDRHTIAGSWQRWWNQDAPLVGPRWWQWLLWPLVYSAMVAVGFTVMGFALFASGDGAWRNWAGWAEWYGRNLLFSLAMTYAILLVMQAGRRLIGPVRLRALTGWRRHGFYTGLSFIGVLLGWPIGYWLSGSSTEWVLHMDANSIVGFGLLGLLIAAFFQMLWITRAREVAARMQATEARLALLQAQIEPHFLFNTLANVLSLIEHDTPRAKAMLESFIDYLRGALGQLRDSQATVATELTLAEAYLALMAVRMDDRLRYTIRCAPEARELALPVLLLQPLVENAIRHGLEPKIDGGSVAVEVALHQDRLMISVRDDGMGADAHRRIGQRAGAGMALANIRERLATRYGPAASLQLLPQQPGMLAVLLLPLA
jgi:signal transduction histidine kinase